MPKQNGMAKWAQITFDIADATAKDIMRSVSLDNYAITYGNAGAQWDNYMNAGRDAVVVLTGAVALVEYMERGV